MSTEPPRRSGQDPVERRRGRGCRRRRPQRPPGMHAAERPQRNAPSQETLRPLHEHRGHGPPAPLGASLTAPLWAGSIPGKGRARANARAVRIRPEEARAKFCSSDVGGRVPQRGQDIARRGAAQQALGAPVLASCLRPSEPNKDAASPSLRFRPVVGGRASGCSPGEENGRFIRSTRQAERPNTSVDSGLRDTRGWAGAADSTYKLWC